VSLKGISNLAVGLLLAIVVASVSAIVLWRIRENSSLVVESTSAPTITVFAVKYNTTHYMLVVYNYGYTPRENARIVRSDGYVYTLATLPPRSSPLVLYVPVKCGGVECTYTYIDASSRGVPVGVIKK